MHLPHYPVESSAQLDYFEFTSYGHKGPIAKMVHYVPFRKDLYNLAFGEKVAYPGYCEGLLFSINDKVISDNGDRDLVLATVATTVYKFTDRYPDRRIYFTGSSPARTRLYRIAISQNLEELSKDFFIFGLVDEMGTGRSIPQAFCKEGNYTGFIIYRKKILQ